MFRVSLRPTGLINSRRASLPASVRKGRLLSPLPRRPALLRFSTCLVKLQEVFLTGKAAQKELKYCDLSPQQRAVMLKAMAKDWDKWTEFKASLDFSPSLNSSKSWNEIPIGRSWAPAGCLPPKELTTKPD